MHTYHLSLYSKIYKISHTHLKKKTTFRETYSLLKEKNEKGLETLENRSIHIRTESKPLESWKQNV